MRVSFDLPEEQQEAGREAEMDRVIAELVNALTPVERHMYDTYTASKPVVVEDEPNARQVWLIVGNQYFQVSGYRDNEDEATWMRAMLAKALAGIERPSSHDSERPR